MTAIKLMPVALQAEPIRGQMGRPYVYRQLLFDSFPIHDTHISNRQSFDTVCPPKNTDR